MRIRGLGPVAVVAGGVESGLGGPKPRTVLVALLRQARQVVATERVIDLLWGGEPPQSATALVHTYTSQLRKVLVAPDGRRLLLTRSPGYLLDVGEQDSDVETFYRLVREAREAEGALDAARASAGYAEAVALWSGPAFDGVEADFARSWAVLLEEERLAAHDGLARAELTLGRAEAAVGPLRLLVGDNPLREETRGLLMRALYDSGRRADALEVYRDGRRLLLDELGIEPGSGLRELHAAMLEGVVTPLPGQRPAPVAIRATPAPPVNNLPPDVVGFTGREEELAALTAATGTVVVSGFGGVGKSALAVHAAYLVRERYSDGSLFVDLRGVENPLDAQAVLGRFLSLLGVEVPATLDDRVELYRRTMADRRVVVVLDNVTDERQVRPLLAHGPGCLAILTSRSRLGGLSGVTAIELGFLAPDVALRMLGSIIGRGRVEREADAADRIVRLCAGVPLALRAAAGKLLARPHWPLTSLANRIADERRRLDELAIGDLAVRSSLELTYAELDARERRAFHLLCLLDLPDFGCWVAAPLLEVTPRDAEDVVERLVDLRLLDVAGVDAIGRVRYRFHDLVGLFGSEHAAVEPADVVVAALTRLTTTWMGLVEIGERGLPRATLGVWCAAPPGPLVDPELTKEVEGAPGEWLRAETGAVVRTIERAAEFGVDRSTTLWPTLLLSSLFAVRNEFDGWRRTHEVALAAARRGHDRQAEAFVLAGLAQLHHEQDDFAGALAHYRAVREHGAALPDGNLLAIAAVGLGRVHRDLAEFSVARVELAEAIRLGDRNGNAEVVSAAHYALGAIARDHGDLDQAAGHLRRCVDLYQTLGDRRGEALALRGLSLCHRARCQHAEAVALSESALEILCAIGDELSIAYARQSWAKAKVRQGATAGVDEALAAALEVCTRSRDRFGVALMTRTLGELRLARGDLAGAREALGEARRGWAELDLPLWRARTMRDLAAATDGPDADAIWAEALEVFAAAGARERSELADRTPASWRAEVFRAGL